MLRGVLTVDVIIALSYDQCREYAWTSGKPGLHVSTSDRKAVDRLRGITLGRVHICSGASLGGYWLSVQRKLNELRARAVPVSVQPVCSVTALKTAAGDIVVLHVEDSMSPAQIGQQLNHVRSVLPDGVRTLALAKGVELSVIKAPA